MFGKFSNILPSVVLHMLYNTLIAPYLSCCNLALAANDLVLFEKLFRRKPSVLSLLRLLEYSFCAVV